MFEGSITAPIFSTQMLEKTCENLLIQQIEFCSTLVLNKTDLVTSGSFTEAQGACEACRKTPLLLRVNGDIQ